MAMKIPADAVQCNGPLMYDPSRFITADGTMFKNYKSSGVKELCSTKKTFSWANAKKLIGDKEESMETISGFYDLERGTIPRHALVAYYFVEKSDPTKMIADMIDQEGDVEPENLRWVPISEEEVKNGLVCNSKTLKGVNCKNSGTKRCEGKRYCGIHFKKISNGEEAPKTESTACAAKTQKGTDCKKSGTYRHGEDFYCGVHHKMITK